MVAVASGAESTRLGGSRWTKLLISLQRRSCVVLWLSRLPTTETDLLVCCGESVVPLALKRKRLAQCTTRKPTRKRRNPETDVGDIEEDTGHWEVVSGQGKSHAHRVHIPSLRTAHHAALAPLAATAPSKLDSREGCLHWWRVWLENFELSSEPMLKDVKTLTQKYPKDLSFFHNRCICVSVRSLRFATWMIFECCSTTVAS